MSVVSYFHKFEPRIVSYKTSMLWLDDTARVSSVRCENYPKNEWNAAACIFTFRIVFLDILLMENYNAMS